MQRPIRFRGLIKQKGSKDTSNTWVYGYLVLEGGFAYIISETGKKHYVDWNSVGESTGLKDKNGLEIYEGDIVRVQSGWVDEGDGKGYATYENREIPQVDFYWGLNGILFDESSGEVIGNIYENPELLEEQ